MPEALLRCEDVSVAYQQARKEIRVVDDFNLDVCDEPTALMGPSGSGKTSLLRCIAGFQTPTSGAITLDGTSIDVSGDARVSFIFQDHRLVEFISVADNLRLAAELRGLTLAHGDVDTLLADVGLTGYGNRVPTELSGGEAQRVAIARAVATKSRLLLADEPTGSLDRANSELVTRMLIRICAERDIVLLVATHDPVVADLLGRIVQLEPASVAAPEKAD